MLESERDSSNLISIRIFRNHPNNWPMFLNFVIRLSCGHGSLFRSKRVLLLCKASYKRMIKRTKQCVMISGRNWKRWERSFSSWLSLQSVQPAASLTICGHSWLCCMTRLSNLRTQSSTAWWRSGEEQRTWKRPSETSHCLHHSRSKKLKLKLSDSSSKLKKEVRGFCVGAWRRSELATSVSVCLK